jgi:hypothetical protein
MNVELERIRKDVVVAVLSLQLPGVNKRNQEKAQ